MISIIQTAIITIIISFISGLLLEYYKNLAPRIFCNIGNGIPLELNSKKICAYILTVRNLSNKTIHELTLNVQNAQNNLKVGDAQITRGLKFDSSIKKDKILDHLFNENVLDEVYESAIKECEKNGWWKTILGWILYGNGLFS